MILVSETIMSCLDYCNSFLTVPCSVLATLVCSPHSGWGILGQWPGRDDTGSLILSALDYNRAGVCPQHLTYDGGFSLLEGWHSQRGLSGGGGASN